STCQCRRHGFNPRAGRSHMPWKACTPQLESSLCLPQLEKNLCGNEDPAQPKINKEKRKVASYVPVILLAIYFLFKFKMGHKAVETTRNINNVAVVVQEVLQRRQSLEDEEHSGQPVEVDKNQMRAIIKADSPTTTGEVAKELNDDRSLVVWHLKHIGKLTTNKKYHRFEVLCSLRILCNDEPFLNRTVTCTQWLDQEVPKHFPKPNLHMVTVWWSAAGLIHYSFLNPGETITSEKYAQQIDEMHQKLQCLQLSLVNRKGPVLHNNARPYIAQPVLQKLNELDYGRVGHDLATKQQQPYSPNLLPTNYYFFKHLDNFLQGRHFHNQQDAKNAFQVFIRSQSTYFYATGISKLISCWQKCVDCNGSYFD
ncbi:hypothetical protein FD755_012957, partial [Muntiacus reevesi]